MDPAAAMPSPSSADSLDAPSTDSDDRAQRVEWQKQSALAIQLSERWWVHQAALQQLVWQWTDAATSEYMASSVMLLAVRTEVDSKAGSTQSAAVAARTSPARQSTAPSTRASKSPTSSARTGASTAARGSSPKLDTAAVVALPAALDGRRDGAAADKLLGQLESLHELLMEHITHVAPVLRCVSAVHHGASSDGTSTASNLALGADDGSSTASSLALLLHRWAPTMSLKDVEARATREGDKTTAALVAAAEVIEKQAGQIAALRRALYTSAPAAPQAAPAVEDAVGSDDAHVEQHQQDDHHTAQGADVDILVEVASTIQRSSSDVSSLAASDAGGAGVSKAAGPATTRRASTSTAAGALTSAAVRRHSATSLASPSVAAGTGAAANAKRSAAASVSSVSNIRPAAPTGSFLRAQAAGQRNNGAATHSSGSPSSRPSRESSSARDSSGAPAPAAAVPAASPPVCDLCEARKRHYVAPESHDPNDSQVDRYVATSALSSSGDATSTFALDATALVLTLRQTVQYLRNAAMDAQNQRRRAETLAVSLAAVTQQCAVARLAGAWTPASYTANRVNEAMDAMRHEYEEALKVARQQQASAERDLHHAARKLAKVQRQLAQERDAVLAAEARAQSLSAALSDAALNLAMAPLLPIDEVVSD